MRRATLHNALTKGEMDPDLSERFDLQHYWNALDSGLNLESRPQGGIRRRDGTTNNGHRLRRRVAPLPVTAGMVTAANGGAIADLLDQSLTTQFVTAAVAGDTFVLFEINLGAPADVCFVDLHGYHCATGRYAAAVAVEYWDGDEWIAFAPDAETARKDLGAYDGGADPPTGVKRTRRFALTPGEVVTAQVWRAVVYGAAGAGVITVGRVRLWTELRALSAMRGITFAKSTDLVYELILAERNIDVFQNHEYLQSVPVPVDAAQVMEVAFWQEQDTLFLYHEDITTQSVVRQGAGTEWHAADCVFSNVPEITSGMAFSGEQDEAQDVMLPGVFTGDTIVLWFHDQVSAPITYLSTTFAAAVASALTAFGVPAGVTVAMRSGATPGVRITFAGDAGGRRWPVVLASAITGQAAPQTTIVRRGIDIEGPIFGETTGYARCGGIVDERHLMAGFRGAPMTYGFSRFGDPFDYQDDADPLTADLGFFATLNSKEVQTIHQIAVATDIHFFTEKGEWWGSKGVIDATLPLQVKQSSANGIKSSVPVVFGEDAMLFLQRGGTILRDMVYSDVELKYKAASLSLLAPHLIKDVRDFGFRQQRNDKEANHLYLVNADGSVTFGAFLRSQEIVSMIPWDLGGKVRGAFADISYRTWFLVERETAAGADIYLEMLDDTHRLDSAIKVTFSTPSDVIEVGSHLEGKAVWAWADRDVIGPFTVTGGEITLPDPVSEAIVGLFPVVRGRLPRFRERLQNSYPWRPPARIYEQEYALVATGDLDIAVNGGPFQKVKLTVDPKRKLDIANDPPRDTSGQTPAAPAPAFTDASLPLLDRLFTGNVTITNLRGFSDHPTSEFSQSIPAPMEIKAIRSEVASNG